MTTLKVRDYRENPIVWQDKTALRKMRDHFSGTRLAKMRSLYLALTEYGSDNEQDSFQPNGGDETLRTYGGLTDKAMQKARTDLMSLEVVTTISLYAESGGQLGYYYILTTPDRDSSLIENPSKKQLTIDVDDNPRTKDLDSKIMGSMSMDSGGHLEVKELLEDKDNVENKDNNICQDDIDQIIKVYKKESSEHNALVHHTKPVIKNNREHVRNRLKDGFTVQQCKDAIFGAIEARESDRSWWTNQEDLEGIFKTKSGKYVEQFARWHRNEYTDSGLEDDDYDKSKKDDYVETY